MKVPQLLLVVAGLFGIGLAVPVPDPQFLGQHQPFFQRPNRPRPFLRPGGLLSGLLANGQQQPQPAIPATPADPHKTPETVVPAPVTPETVVPAPVTPVASPTGEVAAVPDASAAPKNPGSLFTPGGSTGSNSDINKLLGMLNGGQFGSATAGGAGNGAVQDGAAIGQGTGIANVGPGGFGIGLGIGGAIATPLGNLAFGQGDSIAVGK